MVPFCLIWGNFRFGPDFGTQTRFGVEGYSFLGTALNNLHLVYEQTNRVFDHYEIVFCTKGCRNGANKGVRK